MGKHTYKKSEPSALRGICVRCGLRQQTQKGNGKYRPLCAPCVREVQPNAKKRYKENADRKHRPYIVHRKNYCERCGFIPEHMCQLDVDHVDGNHQNNDPANLQTLCANCHRLKTYKQRWDQL